MKCLISGIDANENNRFSLEENNYIASVSLLKDIFGRHEILEHAHLSNLLDIERLKRNPQKLVFSDI